MKAKQSLTKKGIIKALRKVGIRLQPARRTYAVIGYFRWPWSQYFPMASGAGTTSAGHHVKTTNPDRAIDRASLKGAHHIFVPGTVSLLRVI